MIGIGGPGELARSAVETGRPSIDIARVNVRTPAILEASDVRKVIGGREILRGIDVVVRQGQILAIVGPNGAGKTTALRLLSSLARPTSGRITVGGYDTVVDAQAVRASIGVVFGSTFLHDTQTGRENLAYYAALHGVRPADGRIEDVVRQVGMAPSLDQRVSTYSRGMAQRLSIARALLHRPLLLLLDEPETGLDPTARDDLRRLMVGDDPARSVVLATHDLELALRVADDVAVLHQGRFIAAMRVHDITIDALRTKIAGVGE